MRAVLASIFDNDFFPPLSRDFSFARHDRHCLNARHAGKQALAVLARFAAMHEF